MVKIALKVLLLLSLFQTHGQNLNRFDVLITEIMSDPTPNIGVLPNKEYFEIFNNTADSILLSDLSIIVGKKSFQPDSFLLPPQHHYVFWDPPTLKNSGDSIILKFADKIIHFVHYSPTIYESEYKKDGGWSMEMTDYNMPCLFTGNWKSSADPAGGTPGNFNSVSDEIPLKPLKCINAFPVNDTIILLKFNLPIIHFEQLSLYSEAFQLKVHSIYNNTMKLNLNKPLVKNEIYSISISNLQSCANQVLNTQIIKIGKPESVGEKDIIITEILFNPKGEGSDYIEIKNNSDKIIDVSKLLWTSKNSSNEIESGTIIYNEPLLIFPDQYLVFCEDTNWLLNNWPDAQNYFESKIQPMNNDEDNIILMEKNTSIIDELNYQEDWHNSNLNDYENVALEKINLKGLNTSYNWTSGSSVVNFGTPGYINSNNSSAIAHQNEFKLKYDVISPNMDGVNDLLLLQYHMDNPHWMASVKVYNNLGQPIYTISNNEFLGSKGVITWDGYLQSSVITPGIYVLHIEGVNHETNHIFKQILTFYINAKL